MPNKDAGEYAELQREMMASLRATHPDWTDDIFDSYEMRFAEIIRSLLGRNRRRQLKSTVQMA